MHGHKRAEYKARLLDPKVSAGLQHKANQWFKLNQKVLSMPLPNATTANNEVAPTSIAADTDSSPVEASTTLTKGTTLTNLELISNMLQVNPDPLYLWQRRRSLLLSLFLSADSNDSEGDNRKKKSDKSIFDQYISEEWVLTRKCLERNPKAYGAWFHRKWSVVQAVQRHQSRSDELEASALPVVLTSSSSSLSLLEHELQLTELFLNLDERNFHCWSYRRFIVGCLCGNTSGEITLMNNTVLFGPQVGLSSNQQQLKNATVADNAETTGTSELRMAQIWSILKSEFDFTTLKIRQNFSSGSAFHYRSKLLPFILSGAENAHGDGKDDADDRVSHLLANELELAHNAIFTEPDDQTAWWYYDFLLIEYAHSSTDVPSATTTTQTSGSRSRGIDLELERELLEELIDVEGGQSKWALLGLYNVLLYMNNNPQYQDVQRQRQERQVEILVALKKIDPDRRIRYQEMLKKEEATMEELNDK